MPPTALLLSLQVSSRTFKFSVFFFFISSFFAINHHPLPFFYFQFLIFFFLLDFLLILPFSLLHSRLTTNPYIPAYITMTVNETLFDSITDALEAYSMFFSLSCFSPLLVNSRISY